MATNKEQRLLELLARETNKMVSWRHTCAALWHTGALHGHISVGVGEGHAAHLGWLSNAPIWALQGPVPGGRRPAQFRETLRDTHKTMPAEDFGPSTRGLGLGTGTAGSRSQGGSHSARGPGAGAGRSQSLGRAGTRTRNAHSALPFGPEATEFRSVFKPRPDQEHVCSMAREHRDRIAKSEWALLDTLEVQMYLDEKAARARQIEAEKVRACRPLASCIASSWPASWAALSRAVKQLQGRWLLQGTWAWRAFGAALSGEERPQAMGYGGPQLGVHSFRCNISPAAHTASTGCSASISGWPDA